MCWTNYPANTMTVSKARAPHFGLRPLLKTSVWLREREEKSSTEKTLLGVTSRYTALSDIQGARACCTFKSGLRERISENSSRRLTSHKLFSLAHNNSSKFFRWHFSILKTSRKEVWQLIYLWPNVEYARIRLMNRKPWAPITDTVLVFQALSIK